MTTKQIQQIFQYIQSNGNFLGSQKVLREVQKHQDTTWQILVRLSSKLADRNIENAFSQMTFILQSQKHQRSLKFLKDYMIIHDLAQKTQSNYSILDYLKPQKDKIIPIIIKIIQILKGTNKLKQEMDYQIAQNDTIVKDFVKFRVLEQSTTKQLNDLRIRKEKQLPLYQEKVRQKNQIIRKINQKKKEKLEKMEKQRKLREEYNKKEKQSEQLDFKTADQKFTIARLKRQITINAPQVKKQRRALQQQHLQLQKTYTRQLSISSSKHKIFRQQVQLRNKYSSGMIEITRKIISVFQSLQQNKVKLKKLIQQNEKCHKKQQQLQHEYEQICQNINSLKQRRTQLSYVKKNTQSNYHSTTSTHHQKSVTLSQLNQILLKISSKHELFTTFITKSNQQLHQLSQSYQSHRQKITNSYNQWLMQTNTYIQKLKVKNQNHVSKLKNFNNQEYLDDLFIIGKEELMKKIDVKEEIKEKNRQTEQNYNNNRGMQ